MAWYNDWGDFTSGVSDVASSIPGAGLVKGVLGTAKDALVAPNSYDAKGELAKSEEKAGKVFDAGMAGMAGAAGGPPTANITAQQIATPAAITAQTVAAPSAVTARDVGTSGLVAGPQADALRQQALDQAASAAASPSSAAAQMRAAGAQISRQQLAQAAMARGGDRAGARRAAMLATGDRGLQAAGTTAALAAQETAQKQAAYTSALQGIRSGDVSIADAATRPAQLNQLKDIQLGQLNTGNELTAARSNQDAGLQAAIHTGDQRLTAERSNQDAGLKAQDLTIGNKQGAWKAGQEAQQKWGDLALQSVGAQNQAQGVAAGYGAKQNEVRQQTSGGLVSGVASAIGLSDEMVKTEIAPIGDGGLDSLMSSTHGTSSYADLANEFGTPDTGPTWRDRLSAGLGSMGAHLQGTPSAPIVTGRPGQNFLNWQMPQLGSSAKPNGGGLDKLVSAVGSSGMLSDLSDERAKREVERMDDEAVADWAESVPTAVWRFKDGVPGTDGGEDYHAGTLARGLQGTGPLGKLMVHRRPDGLKEVEYGPLGLMVGKGALARADEALDWAKAAYSMAAGKGLSNGR